MKLISELADAICNHGVEYPSHNDFLAALHRYVETSRPSYHFDLSLPSATDYILMVQGCGETFKDP